MHVVGWRPPLSPEARRKLPLQAESAQERALREIAEAAGGPLLGRRLAGAAAPGLRARSPTRWAIATCCATSLPESQREGWHRIEARLRGVKGDVHVRHGYWVADAVRD